MAHEFIYQNACNRLVRPAAAGGKADRGMQGNGQRHGQAQGGYDRQALMAMLGDDPENAAIDCRSSDILESVSENFRITIADVARFIMELKQDEVA